jgi:hypothetical protein
MNYNLRLFFNEIVFIISKSKYILINKKLLSKENNLEFKKKKIFKIFSYFMLRKNVFTIYIIYDFLLINYRFS